MEYGLVSIDIGLFFLGEVKSTLRVNKTYKVVNQCTFLAITE
jgi:hypothetical protein